MSKRLIPIVVMIVGLLIILSAVGILLHSIFAANFQKGLLPPALGGMPLKQAVFGPEAIAGVIELHGVDFPLEDAAIGQYGNQGEITLWVSVESDETTAAELNDLMTEKINEGRSPFTLPVIRQIQGTPVYVLEGLGQIHYYWQAGDLILWLAADYDIANQILGECLGFYQ
jgi:hypothetical protein